jgi:hypothetical protein
VSEAKEESEELLRKHTTNILLREDIRVLKSLCFRLLFPTIRRDLVIFGMTRHQKKS